MKFFNGAQHVLHCLFLSVVVLKLFLRSQDSLLLLSGVLSNLKNKLIDIFGRVFNENFHQI